MTPQKQHNKMPTMGWVFCTAEMRGVSTITWSVPVSHFFAGFGHESLSNLTQGHQLTKCSRPRLSDNDPQSRIAVDRLAPFESPHLNAMA